MLVGVATDICMQDEDKGVDTSDTILGRKQQCKLQSIKVKFSLVKQVSGDCTIFNIDFHPLTLLPNSAEERSGARTRGHVALHS